ncbi:MAG TPA: glycosyltransferase [Gallionellaceae bacterium]
MYLSVRTKFLFALLGSSLWALVSTLLAHEWIQDLGGHIGVALAAFFIAGIAIVPGFMNSFLMFSLLMDKRPERKRLQGAYPPLTILVAAYNEAATIEETLQSIDSQIYPGELQVIVINDGSTDDTAAIVRKCLPRYYWLTLLDLEQNGGKANALNQALKMAKHDLVLTVDADSYLYHEALQSIVERYLQDPPNTRAVAGTVLVRNSRASWLARAQEWDYFHGIAAIKRTQSLFQGTLVAQGSFSLYDRATLLSLGGWPVCVGEDIVLTWAILKAGYRVGHCEDACLFTNAPATLAQFFRQRRRWARGMVEAFKHHPGVLLKPQLPTFFIYWNLLFPAMDLAFTVGFIPGVILALFGHYWIVGPMTLALIPLALAMNLFMFQVEVNMFRNRGLKVRRNPLGFITYAFVYGLLLQPICLIGYLSEMFNIRKSWGTK